MTMFEKPNVGIAFTPSDPSEELVYEAPREHWATTPTRQWVLATLLIVLCAVPYVYPSIKSEFLPGDEVTIKNNPMLYSLSGLGTIWGAPQHLPQFSPASYSFLLFERLFFARNPRGYHIVSIMVHACNALLLWLLLRRLELPGAWLGAALFAVSPVQVDAISWISQQRYLVCTFFYLCALLVYLRRAGLNPLPPPPLPGSEPLIEIRLPEGTKSLYALSIGLFIMAILSHAMGATFPLVVLVMIWWERGSIKKADVVPLIAFAAISIAFCVTAAMFTYHRAGLLWYAAPGWFSWIGIWGRGVWTYFFATILPIHLSFAYSKWTADTIRVWHWILFVAALGVVVALWKMRVRWGRGPITAALLFLCLLLPTALGVSDANDADMTGVMIREHVLYLACAAILVPLATLLTEFLARSKWTARAAAFPIFLPIAFMVIVIPLTIATSVHAMAYTSTKALWEDVLHGQGDSVVALNTLGQLEMDDKDYGSAEQHFEAAYKAAPGDPQSGMNLARVAVMQLQYDVAARRYYEVLAHHPENVQAHFGLGDVLSSQHDTAGALREYSKVEVLDPRNPLLFNNLGLIDAATGDPEKAEAQYRKAISIDPRCLPAYINLANTQFQEQKFDASKDTLQKLLDIDPQSYIAWLNAGVMAEALNDLPSSEQYFRNAIICKFDCALAFKNLGIVLMRRGDLPGKTDRLGEAIYCFKRAFELDPTDLNSEQNQKAAQDKKDEILHEQQQ